MSRIVEMNSTKFQEVSDSEKTSSDSRQQQRIVPPKVDNQLSPSQKFQSSDDLKLKQNWSMASGHSNAVRNAHFWFRKTWRRCTDVICLLLYILIYLVVLIIGFVEEKTRAMSFSERSALFLQPTDKIRRQCGSDFHSDHLALDYSQIVQTHQEAVQFCHLMQKIKLDFADQAIYPGLNEINCSDLFIESRQPQYNSNLSYELFNILRTASPFQNLTDYNIGLANEQINCLRADQFKAVGAHGTLCQLAKVNAAYAFDIEFSNVLNYLQKTITDDAAIDATHKAVVLKLVDSRSQVLTTSEYLIIESLVNKLVIEGGGAPLFILRFINPLPNQEHQKYMRFLSSEILFKNILQMKCQIDYQVALSDKNTSATDSINMYIEYFTQSFNMPIQSALLEFDNSLNNFIITFFVGIVIAFLFQILMCLCAKTLVGICMVGLICGIIFLCYYLSSSGVVLLDNNKQFYELNGFYNQTMQLQSTAIFIVVAILIIVAIILISVSCLFASIIQAIGNTIRTAAKVARKIWFISVYPFVLLAFCIAHIILYAYLIFSFSASGRFDARYSVFVFTDNEIGEGIHYTPADSVLLIFYIIMLVHGLFLCSDIIDYVVGAATIQHYFQEQQLGKWKQGFYVAKACMFMFQQVGSIILKSFFTMFMIYARPVFYIISSKYPQIPESGFMKCFVLMSRKYISVCSVRTTFSMAFTGRGLFRSAGELRLFIHGDTTVTNKLNDILSVFSMFGSIFCMMMNYFVLLLIQQFYLEFQKVRYIWMMILSSCLGFLTSTFISNLLITILDAICFSWSYERVIGVSRIEMEPSELRELRALYGITN